MVFLFSCFGADKAEATSIAPRIVGSQAESLLPNPRNNSKRNAQLCDNCQYWDNIQDVFAFMTTSGSMKRKPTSLADMLQHNACIICRVIAPAVQTKTESLGWRITDTGHVQIVVGGAFKVPRVQETTPTREGTTKTRKTLESPPKSIKCVLYLDVYHQKESFESDFTKERSWHWWPAPSLGLQLLLVYDEDPIRITNVNLWEEKYFDTNAMQRWISDCESQHAGQCQKNITKGLPAHFKLINIDTLCIVDASEPQRFVALSYMWGGHEGGKDLQLVQSNVDQLSQSGGLELQQLPNTISDAIVLCRDLGEHRLWVDRLCIVQDEPVTKELQINAMHTIYGMAAFTIVAAVDRAKATGLPGVQGRPRTSFLDNDTRLFNAEGSHVDLNFFVTVDKSAWNTRGWTFQERVLSTRCIYITNHQVYFTCPQILVQEELGAFQQKDKFAISPPSHFSVPNIHELTTETSYLDCASHYTSRNLSYESDIEKAFTGVSNVLAAEMGTRFLFCLPEKYFTASLLWQSIANPTTRRNDAVGIPSWSWAGWSGAISYDRFAMNVMAQDIGTLVTFHMQFGDHGLRQLDMEDNWFGANIDFSNCPILKETRHRYTPDLETTEEIWRGCPHSPWEAKYRLKLNPLASQVAVKHPGCLVFNTTIAALTLRPNTAHSAKLATVSLDICSPHQEKIGDINIDCAWMNEKVDLKQAQTFIVLCAGILSKSKRRDLHHEQFLYNREDRNKSPWLLIVMLVQQREDVSERLGIGYVEARLWERAHPVWETIVLM
jgi:hypothetical protein